MYTFNGFPAVDPNAFLGPISRSTSASARSLTHDATLGAQVIVARRDDIASRTAPKRSGRTFRFLSLLSAR